MNFIKELEADLDKSECKITMDSVLLISDSSLIKDYFKDIMTNYSKIIINHSLVEEVDISYFQILYSLYKTTIKNGKKLEVIGDFTESFSLKFKLSGYDILFDKNNFNSNR